MFLQYVADVERHETLVELRTEVNRGTIAFVVVDDDSRRAEIHFAVDGELHKIPLGEFEAALREAKSRLMLAD